MKKNPRLFERPFPRVDIHPDSIKHTKKGHPWIIDDSFTKQFPKTNLFLIGIHPKTKEETVLFINDWRHPKIKGRVWSHQEPFVEKIKNFEYDLGTRLESSLIKRIESNVQTERDNFYWIFGEADLIPGLFIQFMGDMVLIQTFASFWFPLQFTVTKHVQRLLEKHLTDKEYKVILQERFPGGKEDIKKISKKISDNLDCHITEFGIKYEVKPFDGNDPGIYTDAASVRKKMKPYFEEAKNVLNLYSYTGAFSLQGLKHEREVTSVDLSSKYMSWLEKNIRLNEFKTKHTSMVMSSEQALKKLLKSEKKFDLIICDPPSSSTDGKKITQALKKYEDLVPLILNNLENKGHAALFLNTHSVSKKKFQEKILELIKGKAKIVNEFKLGEDCPTLKGFPEGNYLKVLIIKKSY
jgi:23S rRNA (cytosine1962-C5)-methyltransferase